jgi:hypothetical protein
VTGIGFKKNFAEYATIDLASKERVTRIINVPGREEIDGAQIARVVLSAAALEQWPQ